MSKSRLLQYKNAALQDNVSVASVDCFDTLLLRESKTEAMRWLEISTKQLEALNACGIDCRVSPRHVARLRVGATKLWMSDASMRNLSQQSMHKSILSMIASELGLPEKAVEMLRDAELSYELNVLRANRRLISVLQELMDIGKRVISISDMYLSSDDIKWLTQNIWEAGGSLTFYSSANLGVTKADGGAYRKVLQLEEVQADCMVHAGDNKHADVVVARRHGIEAIHMPRPWTHRATHFANRAIDSLRTSTRCS